MTKNIFEYTVKSLGFIEDTEYKGIFHHPDAHWICTWFSDRESFNMAIGFDTEYVTYRQVSHSRILALLNLYKND